MKIDLCPSPVLFLLLSTSLGFRANEVKCFPLVNHSKVLAKALQEASSNKCHASSNRCLTSSNKKLVVTSARLERNLSAPTLSCTERAHARIHVAWQCHTVANANVEVAMLKRMAAWQRGY